MNVSTEYPTQMQERTIQSKHFTLVLQNQFKVNRCKMNQLPHDIKANRIQ